MSSAKVLTAHTTDRVRVRVELPEDAEITMRVFQDSDPEPFAVTEHAALFIAAGLGRGTQPDPETTTEFGELNIPDGLVVHLGPLTLEDAQAIELLAIGVSVALTEALELEISRHRDLEG